MPGKGDASMNELRERIAALAASFEAEKGYQHDRWHKLDQDLTPITMLPEKLTREIGRLQGIFDGRLNAASREFERTMEAAIEKALKPVAEDLNDLKVRIGMLETSKNQLTGGQKVVVWVVQTFFAAVVAAVALVKLQHP